jgi:SAM-dependent methyltransferase
MPSTEAKQTPSAQQGLRGLIGWFRATYHRLPSPPSTNYNLHALDVHPYELIPDGSVVLDIGAGTLDGMYEAFPARNRKDRDPRLITLDIDPHAAVGVRGDAHAVPLKDKSIDAVLCVSVLEYVHSPERVLAECYRVLKPAGIVYLSAPFVFPHHPPPLDRFRFSMSGLCAIAKDFEVIRTGYNRGPASTFLHVWVHFVAIAFSFGSRSAYGVLLDLAKWGFFWMKYLDRWLGRLEPAHVLHGSAFFLGRKPISGDRPL